MYSGKRVADFSKEDEAVLLNCILIKCYLIVLLLLQTIMEQSCI